MNISDKLELQFGWCVEPLMDCKRVRICYIKNGKEQNAIFMNYGTYNNNYKMIEDTHTARNGLTTKEQDEIAKLLNNNEIELYGEK